MTGLAESKAHVFVEDLEVPVLADQDQHHLGRVLRLSPGEPVTVSDGAGSWRACRFGVELVPEGPIVVEPPLRPEVTVAFAVVKGERPDWTVQKLTELGVDRIVPFLAARSVVRWDGARGDRHVVRLQRVAREAAMQSRRVHLPLVEAVATFADVASRPDAVLAAAGGRPPAAGDSVVLVGPEGGWSDEERGRGLPEIGLGPTVLRAETAAVAAGVLLTALRPGGALTAT